MGRIRTIKPEILDDRAAAKLSDAAWRLWVSAWVIADDEGLLPGDIEFLRARVFWGDIRRTFDECSRALAECSDAGVLHIYDVDGDRFVQICNFRKHQKIDKPSPAKFPKPSQGVTISGDAIRRTVDERSTSVRHGIGREGKGMGEEGMQGENAPPVASPPATASAGEPEPDQHDAELDAKFWRVLGEDLRVEAEKARAELVPVVVAEENPPGKKTPRRKPARALPADWAPNAGHRELAAEQRVDVSAEAVKFRDYGIATGKTYADHDAAFRNWLRRAQPRQNGVQLARGSQAPRKFRDYLSELKARTSESENLLEKLETAESLEALK